MKTMLYGLSAFLKLRSLNKHTPKLRNEDFQNWELVVLVGGSAVLICDDGNGHRLYAKQIAWTDFPRGERQVLFLQRHAAAAQRVSRGDLIIASVSMSMQDRRRQV
jgi:hypothetical protein